MLPSLSVKVFDESEFLHELDHPAESERRGGGAMTRGFLRFVLCPESEKVFLLAFQLRRCSESLRFYFASIGKKFTF